MKSKPNKKQKQITIRGEIGHIQFKSEDGNFIIGTIDTVGAGVGSVIKFMTKSGGLRENDNVILHGKWSTHPKYGRQFEIKSFEYDTELDDIGVQRYIANNPAIKGIGPSRAAAIAAFCAKRGGFDSIVTDKWRMLIEIPHVSKSIAETLHTQWLNSKELNNTMADLAALGLTHKQIVKLTDKYGGGAARRIKENPYILMVEVDGYGFKRADDVARRAGFPKRAPERVQAGIIYALECARDAGHTAVRRDGKNGLIEKANKILVLDEMDSKEFISSKLEGMVELVG